MHKMALSAAAAGLLAAVFTVPASAADVITAVNVAKAPVLAAGAADPAWSKAKALSVPLLGGVNFKAGKGATNATLKAVYSGDMLYVLLQYDDPTQSVRRFPYQKQADGSWKKLKDANDKGGDDNVYYEDKFALIWNINNSIKGFSQQGCMTACHAGEPGIGQVDDQYLDDTATIKTRRRKPDARAIRRPAALTSRRTDIGQSSRQARPFPVLNRPARL